SPPCQAEGQARADLQRPPGQERLSVLPSGVWPEGRCHRPVGRRQRPQPAPGGPRPGDNLQPRTRARNREEARLDTVACEPASPRRPSSVPTSNKRAAKENDKNQKTSVITLDDP